MKTRCTTEGKIRLEMSKDEAMLLSMYLSMTTQDRLQEEQDCRERAQEKNPDGSPKFPRMEGNAQWWIRTNKAIGRINDCLSAQFQ